MDVATAKTLVSTLLVSSIAVFTIVSLRMFVLEMIRDLRRVRAGAAIARKPAD